MQDLFTNSQKLYTLYKMKILGKLNIKIAAYKAAWFNYLVNIEYINGLFVLRDILYLKHLSSFTYFRLLFKLWYRESWSSTLNVQRNRAVAHNLCSWKHQDFGCRLFRYLEKYRLRQLVINGIIEDTCPKWYACSTEGLQEAQYPMLKFKPV